MSETKTTQIFIKFFNHKTLTLHFPSPLISPQSILNQIQTLTLIQFPLSDQTLTLNGKPLSPTNSNPNTQFFPYHSTLTQSPISDQTLTLNGKPLSPTNPNPQITPYLSTLTQVTISDQTLTLNGKTLSSTNPNTRIIPDFSTLILTLNGKPLSPTNPTPQFIPNYSTLTLHTPLLGGKGGFGSLLRGSGTKAGQKKTNNFDACRDMSGRRLRHVNAEKKLEEWNAEEEGRMLERAAAKFLKERNAKGKGGKKEVGAEKYVEEYRAVSARCVEEVERSVREAAEAVIRKGRKRSGVVKGLGGDAKKLKVWMGKRKMDESDTDDSVSGSENDDTDTENEKSTVIDNGSQSDSSKDATSGSISVQQLGGDQNGGGSSNSDSDENKAVNGGSAGPDSTTCGSSGLSNGENPLEIAADIEDKTMEEPSAAAEMSLPSDLLAPQLTIDQAHKDSEGKPDPAHRDSEVKSAVSDAGLRGNLNVPDLTQPLNFDDFSSATELEALGLERLKSELQARGLKCGGSLQERAARLFLLKTAALEDLPKKLFAKK